MCDKVVSKESFMSKYCLDRYKTRVICGKTVDTFLPTLEFVSDRFGTNKILEKLDNVVIFNDELFSVDVDSNIITFLIQFFANVDSNIITFLIYEF